MMKLDGKADHFCREAITVVRERRLFICSLSCMLKLHGPCDLHGEFRRLAAAAPVPRIGTT
jgi:hypothetical protein